MSRIGRKPIDVPSGVNVAISGNHITVKGTKGTLERDFPADLTVKSDGSVITVERPSEKKEHRSLHGLTRTPDCQHGRGCDQRLQQGAGSKRCRLPCTEAR